MGIGNDYDWFIPDVCRVSQYNQCRHVQSMLPRLPGSAHVRDITVKAGANHEVGCVLELSRFLAYVEKLAEARVPELDCGRCYSAFDLALMKETKRAGLGITLCPSVGERDVPGEVLDSEHYRAFIDRCFENGADEVKLLWESGSMQPPLTRSAAHMLRGIDIVLEMTEYVHQQYEARVSISTADNVRLPMDTQLYFHRKLVKGGVDRVWISDEGHANPSAFRYVVRRFREELGDEVPFAFHVHNSWGLGLANLIAGVEEGGPAPVYLDVSLDGIGLAQPLDEVVLALEFLYGIATGVKLEELYSLSQAGRMATQTAPSRAKPHTGPTSLLEAAGSIVTGLRPAYAEHPDDRVGIYHPGGVNPRVFGAVGGMTAWWGSIPVEVMQEALDCIHVSSDAETAARVIRALTEAYAITDERGRAMNYVTWDTFVEIARRIAE